MNLISPLILALFFSVTVSNTLSAQSDDADSAPTADSLGYTDISLRDKSEPVVADFNTPAPIIDRLKSEREVSWNQITTNPVNLTRFAFGTANSDDVFMLIDTDGTISPNLTTSSDLATETMATNDVLLRSTFQFMQIDTDQYAIYSAKHGNYALDVDSDGVSLILRDVRSLVAYEAGSNTTFLTFSAGASPFTLIANGRYQLNLEASGEARSLVYDAMDWSEKMVAYTGTGLELDGSTGTQMKLYETPIKLSIPTDFNPDNVARVSNAEYFDLDAYEGNRTDQVTQNIDAAYAAQVTSTGSDAETLAAAQTMLDSIDDALADQGSQTRYPQDFYLSFREGLFNRVVQSSESVDGNIGDLTVPYVYFTNEVDANGDYHPFMIVSTHGVPDSLANLGDVARPPGDGITGRYEQQNVTRNYYLENFLFKFPMRDYGEVAEVDENDLSESGSLADDVNETNYDHHNYASPGLSALAIDGVVIYPSYNNRLEFSQSVGELSSSGMHAGRGLGVHYHADSHSAAIVNAELDNGLGLYNEADYAGVLHPPITGIGFDGVAAYGIYLAGDTTSHGAEVALDDFGGHEHHDYGYHYHAMSSDQTSRRDNDYVLHELGPLGAWAGRINNVPQFQERIRRSIWLGNP